MIAAVDNITRLQGLVRAIDQNPAISAQEKRQLIDSLYGTMIQTAHAGNAAFASIDKALAK